MKLTSHHIMFNSGEDLCPNLKLCEINLEKVTVHTAVGELKLPFEWIDGVLNVKDIGKIDIETALDQDFDAFMKLNQQEDERHQIPIEKVVLFKVDIMCYGSRTEMRLGYAFPQGKPDKDGNYFWRGLNGGYYGMESTKKIRTRYKDVFDWCASCYDKSIRVFW